ncbi:MAG: LamG-like jellyroll fold domain-containing protein, partial [Akkermansiaceae bacterium]
MSRALDQDLTPGEFFEFEQHLTSSPEARARYMEYVDLHTILDLELQQREPTQLGISNVVDIKRIIRRQKRRMRRVALIAAAAILLIGLVLMQLFFAQENEPTLVFQTSPGTQYALNHNGVKNAPSGLVLEKGSRLQISQGSVELTFKSGVKSIVMAPADMTLHDDSTLFLNKGTAWFQVPKGAEGFNVKTKELDVVDLGTEFGVFAHADEHDEVHVIKGKVQVTTLRLRKESALLTAGNARRIDPVGRLSLIPLKASRFLTSLPNSHLYMHWSFDGHHPFQPTGSLPEAKTITTRPVQSDSRPASQRIVPGKHGNALSFDGKGDHLVTNWLGILGKTPRTVSCWIKIYPDDPNGWQHILEWGNPHRSNYWRFRIAGIGGKATLRLSLGDHWYNGSSNLADGQWHHIACVDNGKKWGAETPSVRFYIDGEEETVTRRKKTTPTDRNTQEGFPMIMGTNHRYFNVPERAFLRGEIDELFIFRGTLSRESIGSLMHTHSPAT